ncbi:MAG TPA: dimethylmenaquinone methyltransferase [Candidatus Nanopelagicales bacterium]|nr:dimethylmenaquinone methyltransferase [Candidatus Nanopelagicales bacterium]
MSTITTTATMPARASDTARPAIDTRGHAAATLYEAAVAVLAALPADDPIRGSFTGLFSVDPRIRAAWPGARMAGTAFTVQGAGGDNLALHQGVYAAPEGSILVVDVNGAAFGHWGEVLAVAAQSRGITGLLIDGGVRDSVEQSALGFPVFSRNNSVRGTRKLVRGGLGVEVEIGGVPVRTGDTIVADADGVVVLPAEIAEAVVEQADLRVAKEESIIRRLRAGETTLEVYGLD